MSRRRRRVPVVTLLCGLAAALVFSLPAAATGGGEEEMEHLAKQPARVLAQQALALVRLHDPPHDEATERLEAALESKDKENVDVGLLRQALETLEGDNPDDAVPLLDQALSRPLGATSGKELHDSGREFRPAKGTGEVVGIVAGAVLLLVGGLGLTGRRRPRPA